MCCISRIQTGQGTRPKQESMIGHQHLEILRKICQGLKGKFPGKRLVGLSCLVQVLNPRQDFAPAKFLWDAVLSQVTIALECRLCISLLEACGCLQDELGLTCLSQQCKWVQLCLLLLTDQPRASHGRPGSPKRMCRRGRSL